MWSWPRQSQLLVCVALTDSCIWYLQVKAAGMISSVTLPAHLSVPGKSDDSWADTEAWSTCPKHNYWWRCVCVYVCKHFCLCVISVIYYLKAQYLYFFSIAVTLLKEPNDKWHKQELDCFLGLVPLIRADWMLLIHPCFTESTVLYSYAKCNSK